MNSHLDNTVIVTNIQNFSTKLMSQMGDGIKMLHLVSQSLTRGQTTRMVIRLELQPFPLLRLSSWAFFLVDIRGIYRCRHLPVMLEQLLEEFRTQKVNFGQDKFPLDKGRLSIIQNGPHGNQILKLTTGLFNNSTLTLKHNGHARQILHLGTAHNQAVNVEASGS